MPNLSSPPTAHLCATVALSLAALVNLAVPAIAQTAAPTADRAARTWAAACAACHTPAAQATIPSLVGRDADTLTRTLLAFKAGQVPGATVMHQHAKGYTDDELRRIAQVLAAQAQR
jgi:cytochrome c553